MLIRQLLECKRDKKVDSILVYKDNHILNAKFVGIVVSEQNKQFTSLRLLTCCYIVEFFIIDDGTGLLECMISEDCFFRFMSKHVDNNVLDSKSH